jgi:hypothetical protein
MTFDEWIANPGGKGNSVITNRAMVHKNYTNQWDVIRVKENGVISYKLYTGNEDYYIHFKIPTESEDKFYYDVVIRFFPPSNDKTMTMERTLKNYQIQVYSNDPYFVFTYCYAYNSHKMFISDLKNKMSSLALTEPAKVRNPKNQIGYVKSIYFAYLEMKHLDLFSKVQWETISKKYNKNVWSQTVEHSEDLLQKTKEIRAKNKKNKKKMQKETLDNNKLLNKLKPIADRIKSPNIPHFGHFKKPDIAKMQKSFNSSILALKPSKNRSKRKK